MATVQPKFGFPGLKLSGTPTDVEVGGQALAYTDDPTRKYAVAGANSARFAGIAMYDIPAVAAYVGGPKVADANAQVAQTNCVIPVVASGAVVSGDRLICAAAGKVSSAGATPDARFVIGYATQSAADGATFLARIY